MADEELCLAAQTGDNEKVKTLIASGTADVTYFNKEGLTPLMLAAKQGHADVVKTLIDAGAPWNALSPANLSAGDFAMDLGHQDAFDVLLNAGNFTLFILNKLLCDMLLIHMSQRLALPRLTSSIYCVSRRHKHTL